MSPNSCNLRDTEVPDLVKQLKDRIGNDLDLKDAEIKRFLRVRDYDLGKAEDMLKNSLEWRKTVNFADAHKFEFSENLVSAFPFTFDGRDKDGRLVVYAPVGRWKARQNISHKEDLKRMLNKQLSIITSSIDQNTKHEQCVGIIDLMELSYFQVTHYEVLELLYTCIRVYEGNFPDRLYKAVIINAPWVFNMVFPAIKNILSGVTLQKVTVFDSSPDKFAPFLLDLVTPKAIPSGLVENNPKLESRFRTENNNN